MRYIMYCFLAMFVAVSVHGCSWMGRTAGKAQAKIERKVDATEKGYEEGYKQEKTKTEGQ